MTSPAAAPAKSGRAGVADAARLLRFARRVFPLAIAQVIGRLASLVLAAYTGRVLGAGGLGEYALGRTLVQYTLNGTDLGAADIGIRMISRHRELAPLLKNDIQRRRVTLGFIAVLVLVGYSLLGPVPPGTRLLLACFVIGAFPWCIRLDWPFWGEERFVLVSASQTVASLVYVGAAITLMALIARAPLYGVAIAGAISIMCSAALTRTYWNREVTGRGPAQIPALPADIAAEIGWRPVLVLGAARVCNLLFQSIDVMLLGAMVTTREIGHYNAAYRIVVIIFGVYSLGTYAAMPALARLPRSPETRRLIALSLIGSAAAGVVIALALRFFATPVVVLVFGHGLAAGGGLLKVLCFAIPLEFVAAMAASVLIARGSNGLVAGGRAAALVVNVALNLAWIPRHGAYGAAWAAIISYAVLVACWLIGWPLADRIGAGT